MVNLGALGQTTARLGEGARREDVGRVLDGGRGRVLRVVLVVRVGGERVGGQVPVGKIVGVHLEGLVEGLLDGAVEDRLLARMVDRVDLEVEGELDHVVAGDGRIKLHVARLGRGGQCTARKDGQAEA